jgi:spore coat protein H
MKLPVRWVRVESSEWAKLQEDIWSENFVNAHLVHSWGVEPVQLRYRGGHTRNYPKKSFEIRRNTGTMHLNAEYDDPSMIRNALSFKFFEWIGVPSPETKHCHLLLNGEYLGVYLEIEAVDANFFMRRQIPFNSLMYAANDDANFGLANSDKQLKQSLFDGYELIIGNQSDRKRFEQFIFQINTLDASSLSTYLTSHLDIDNYLRWLAGAVCTGNYDGFNQNYAVYEYSGTGAYRLIPWDYEGTWGRNCFGERCDSDSVRITGYNVLTKRLLSISSVMQQYRNILNEILESWFTLERLEPEMERLTAQIRPNIFRDKNRKWSTAEFDNEPDVIRSYIRDRRKFLLQSLSSLC